MNLPLTKFLNYLIRNKAVEIEDYATISARQIGEFHGSIHPSFAPVFCTNEVNETAEIQEFLV